MVRAIEYGVEKKFKPGAEALFYLGLTLAFQRGVPEELAVVAVPIYELGLYELLKAYGENRRRAVEAVLAIEPSAFHSVDEAVERLSRFLGHVPDWRELTSFLPEELRGELFLRSALASTFAATLELARRGRIELRQDRTFGPIYLRSSASVGERKEA